MNDNKSAVMNNAAVQQLRKVPGFDPMKLLRKTIPERLAEAACQAADAGGQAACRRQPRAAPQGNAAAAQ